jgi:hypothetical protein
LLLEAADSEELRLNRDSGSTDLGHTKIAHTYWCPSAVSESMALAGDTFERFVASGGAADA